MSLKTIWLLAVAVVCVYPAAASTYYVGSCKSGSFPTISAAVNAAPAGSTILICAGNYGGQVIISKDLTLKGLDDPNEYNGAGANITAGAGLPTTTSGIDALNSAFGPIAPVFWVTAGNVSIQNLSVTGSSGPADMTCPPTSVGFYYATGASGALNHVAFFGDWCTVGIWAENASLTQTAVTVENSSSTAGIVAASEPYGTLTATIKGNQVFPSQVSVGNFGIWLYGASGTVETNFITGPLWYGTDPQPVTAIVDSGGAQSDVTISGNTIQINGPGTEYLPLADAGIFIGGGSATVRSNKISGAGLGINVNCTAATVSGNTISNAGAGIAGAPAGFTGVNTFFNVGQKLEGGRGC
jgi:nitrous oxidase accessory protein NosD